MHEIYTVLNYSDGAVAFYRIKLSFTTKINVNYIFNFFCLQCYGIRYLESNP